LEDDVAMSSLLEDKQRFLEKALKNYILCLRTGVCGGRGKRGYFREGRKEGRENLQRRGRERKGRKGGGSYAIRPPVGFGWGKWSGLFRCHLHTRVAATAVCGLAISGMMWRDV